MASQQQSGSWFAGLFDLHPLQHEQRIQTVYPRATYSAKHWSGEKRSRPDPVTV